jgi:exosortase
MIPLLSAGLIYGSRREIFAAVEGTAYGGIVVAIAGAVVCAVAQQATARWGDIDRLTAVMVAMVTLAAGLFRWCYGRQAWRAARFPMAFLVFMIPIPGGVLDKMVYFLQHGSAEVVEGLFTLLQISYLRSGMHFELPGLQIEIASECSGIRSSIALFILVVLIAHFALHSWWRKLLLAASVIPLVLFKNGLRIATLCWLAIKVNPGFLSGRLHHGGGFVFFGLVLLVVIALSWALQRWETVCPGSK